MLLILFILFILFTSAYYIFLKKPTRWLKLGTFRQAKTITVNQHQFYIEEVAFKDYQAAIHGYFNIVPELEKYAEVKETVL